MFSFKNLKSNISKMKLSNLLKNVGDSRTEIKYTKHNENERMNF